MSSSDKDNAGLQSVVLQQEEAYEQRRKRWLPDIKNIPCARSALINGILGGLAVGILYFAKSSIVRRSCDLAIGGFALVSLTSWEVCRYQKAKQRAEVKQTVKVLNSLDIHRGPAGNSEEEETRWEPTQATSNNSRT